MEAIIINEVSEQLGLDRVDSLEIMTSRGGPMSEESTTMMEQMKRCRMRNEKEKVQEILQGTKRLVLINDKEALHTISTRHLTSVSNCYVMIVGLYPRTHQLKKFVIKMTYYAS